MIDFNTLDLTAQGEAGYTLQLLHPKNQTELEGVTIKIRGDKSRTVQQFERKRLNELQNKERVLKGKNKEMTFTTEELERMAIEAAVVRVINWSGINENGEPVPFNEENATYMFEKFSWMREQVREAAEDLDNFC